MQVCLSFFLWILLWNLQVIKGTSNIAVKLGSIVLIKAETNGQKQILLFDLMDMQPQNLEKKSISS